MVAIDWNLTQKCNFVKENCFRTWILHKMCKKCMRNLFFVYLFKWFVCQCHFLYKKYVSHILCEQIVRLMFRMFSMNFKNNEKWNEKWNIHISLFTLFWIVPSRTHVSKHTHRVKREICICNCLLYVYLLLICFTLHWSLSFLCIWFCHPLVFQRPKSGAAVLAPHGALGWDCTHVNP